MTDRHKTGELRLEHVLIVSSMSGFDEGVVEIAVDCYCPMPLNIDIQPTDNRQLGAAHEFSRCNSSMQMCRPLALE